MSDAPAYIPEGGVPGNLVKREQKTEYRDQNGVVLDAEQIKELEGKVSFETRFEVHTRMIDAAGNEVNSVKDEGVAPPHPDVDNVDPDTAGAPVKESQDAPARQEDVQADETKERAVENSPRGEAKPASEVKGATKEEL